MDVFKLTTSAYVIEYEIKVSRVDFYKDTYKGDGDKHERLANGTSRCNRFFYVVPSGLVKVEECPDYAGLLYYDGWGFQVIKNAPLLHKTKQRDADYRKLALKLSFRSQLIESKYRRSVVDRKKLEEKLNEVLNAQVSDTTKV
jgi:hypothetical protein